MNDKFIGMAEAAELLQLTDGATARRLFLREGVDVQKLGERFLAVRLADVEQLAAKRGGKVGKGRPRKAPAVEVAA